MKRKRERSEIYRTRRKVAASWKQGKETVDALSMLAAQIWTDPLESV